MSAFTALNGTSPKLGEAQSVPAAPVKDSATSPGERPQSASAQPRQTITDETVPRRESWPTQGPRPDPAAAAAAAAAAASNSHSEGEYSHKRKRSESAEAARGEDTRHRTPDGAPERARSRSRDAYDTPQREYRRYDDERRDREKESWYSQQGRDDRHPYDSQASTGSAHGAGNGDDHNENGRRHSSEQDYPNGSPEADDGDRSVSMYHSSYGDHRPDSILQHDPKKRKRNFSNRTKTGCLTCRKRKKKCDEQKPECSNCIKGGFVCAGYPPQRGAGWPKMDNKAAAVPLESKDPTYIPPGAYGMPQPAYPGQSAKREPLPQFRRQSLRIDPPQGRPLVADGDRPPPPTLPSASVASPENKLSAISYTPANAFPTPVSANTQPPPFGERMGKEYQRVPPIHELGRPDSDSGMHSNHLPQINVLHSGRTSSPTSHPTPSHPAPPHSASSSAQMAAQLALSHSSHSSQYGQRRTQKEEMLSGRHFYPFDKELCLERERCAAACWRFNNLTTPPTNGVSPEERARLFLEILQPRDPVRVSPAEASPVTNVGRVGRHVAVETPFTCDYGYNIIIGHHVVIGRNCTINDVCEVKIGDNCVIGPNVSIYTTSLPIDPKKRQGGQGPQFGRGITIEQDCWIGGGATILPGRTIGKGSTVGAGSIVTKDVPPFTVVAGNPARVLRGIAS